MASSLPKFQNDSKEFVQMQSRWATILDPIINNPITSSSILKGINLAVGSNTVNHLLSRKLQGWTIVRINAATTIYDTQESNGTPDKTLVLVSSAACTVDILVF